MSAGGPWLVTGASGFLGRHLLEAIRSAGTVRPILALVRDPAQWHALDWTGPLASVQILAGTVDQPHSWNATPELDRLAGIFHLAALVLHGHRDRERIHRTNVTGTLELVRLAARHGCRMVFVSTSGTVGCFPKPGPSADETSPYCEDQVRGWPYYRSKLEAEQQARELAAELGVELVIVRPPVLLGPGDHRFRSSGHVLRLLRGRLPFLIEGGMHYADVRDVARALLRIMELPAPRPIYHLPGTVCSLRDFYGRVAALAGMAPPRLVLPYRLAWLAAALTAKLGVRSLPEPALVEMAAHHWAVHSRYAEAELGYRSRPGEETLRDTIVWLREHHPDLVRS